MVSGWTNDISQKVLGARAQKLSGYASPQNLDSLTQLVLSAYTPLVSWNWNPRQIIINKCTNDLKKYAHVDRWLTIFPISLRGPQAEVIAPTVKSNYHLAEAFYEQVKNEIYQRIRAHVFQHYGSDIGGKIVSRTIDNHRCCLELMKPFGQETQCWANTAACGKEARLAIIKEFKEGGTQFYGGMSLGLSQSVSNMVSYEPQEFLCYRPTHVHYFNFYYDKLYGDLPRKLLKSKLQEDSAYVKLKNDVVAAVNQLNSQYDYVAFGVDKVDPVMVGAGSIQDMDEVQKSSNSFGFGPPSTKPGFEFLQGPRNISIDGQTTPLMYFDIMGSIKKPLLKMERPLIQKDLSVINPKDPITNPVYRSEAMGQEVMQTPNQIQALSPTLQTTPKEVAGAGGTATQPMSGTLPKGQAPTTGPVTIQTPVQIKPLSPEVITAPKGINIGQTEQSTNDSMMMGKTPQTGALKIEQPLTPVLTQPILPELMSDPQIVVGGIRTGWGKTVALTSETPVLKVAIEFKIINKGMGASKGFTVNCISAGKVFFQKNIQPMKPGEAIHVKASADLTPGNHLLSVTVDSSGVVMESNEANNRYEIRLNVSMKPKTNIQKRIAPIPIPKSTIPSRN